MRRVIAVPALSALAGCLGALVIALGGIASSVGTWSIPVFIDDWPGNAWMSWTEEVNGIAHDDQGYLYFAYPDAAFTPPLIMKIPGGTDLESYQWPFNPIIPPFPPGHGIYDLGDGVTLSWDLPAALEAFGETTEYGYDHYGDLDQAGGFLFVPVESGPPGAIAVFRTSDLAHLGMAPTAPGQASAGWVAIDPIPPDPTSHPDRRYLYMSNSFIDPGEGNRLFRYTVDFDVLNAGDVAGAIQFLDRVAVKNGDGSPLEPPIGVESAGIGYMQGGVFSPWGDLYLINGDNASPVDEQHAGIHLFRLDPEGSGAFFRVADSVNGAPGFNYQIDISEAQEPEGIDWWDVPIGDLPVATQLHAILLDTNGGDWDTLYVKNYTVNYPPVADAGDDQTVDEGDQVTLSGTFTDQNGGSHAFLWELASATNGQQVPNATTESFTFTAVDNGVYTFRFTVTDDQGAPGSDTVVVTALNVPPTLAAPHVESRPNPEFILPVVHSVTFSGDFTDPGILDTHTAYWDWGDGTSSTGVVAEVDGSGSATQQHTYALPGDYAIALVVTDKDGGHDSGSMQVHVADAGEALGIANAYIQSLPDSVFKNNAPQRKQAFDAKFKALDQMLAAGDYQGLIQAMNADIRSKFDGLVGGNPHDDWIVQDLAVQTHLCQKVDDITAYLKVLLADLG